MAHKFSSCPRSDGGYVLHLSKDWNNAASWLAYTLAIYVFDALFILRHWHRYFVPDCRPTHTPSDIDHLSDVELLDICSTKTSFAPDPTPFGVHNVSRVTPHTLIKGAQDWEGEVDVPSEGPFRNGTALQIYLPTYLPTYLALQLVAEQTSIPVPHVRRIVKGKGSYIAMEYIPGKQLSSVWPTLSLFARLRIAFTLRSYVHQLRAIRCPRSSVPGPLGTTSDGPRMCHSPLFGAIIEMRGPFGTYSDLAAFFDDRLMCALRWRKKQGRWRRGDDDAEKFDDSEPLVLTHQDLNPRNLIVGDDGHLWLVDWSWAGFYPRWWEYVAMHMQAENEEGVMGRKEPFWDKMIPFVCGPYYRQEAWVDRAAVALDWL